MLIPWIEMAPWSTTMGCLKSAAMHGLLAVTLASAGAHAQTYVSLGYGGVTCSTWNSRKPIEGRAYEAWMLGFISSYNAYVFSGPNVVAGAQVDDLRKWIDDYCVQHPDENFDAVVRLLIDDYSKKAAN